LHLFAAGLSRSLLRVELPLIADPKQREGERVCWLARHYNHVECRITFPMKGWGRHGNGFDYHITRRKAGLACPEQGGD
jgi:hypothetical protein